MTKYLYHRRTHLNRDASETAAAVFVVGKRQPLLSFDCFTPAF